jgi:hypothetical protein
MSSIAINSPAVARRSLYRPAVTTALVFVVSFLVVALVMSLEIGAFDEGIILTGAMRVAAGEVPHRDFYANYGPGQFYVLAVSSICSGRLFSSKDSSGSNQTLGTPGRLRKPLKCLTQPRTLLFDFDH